MRPPPSSEVRWASRKDGPEPSAAIRRRATRSGAADIDAGTIAASDIRIYPAKHHGASVKRDDLTILRTPGVAGGTDVILATVRSLELQFLKLRAIGEIHHDTAIGPAPDLDGLAALAARRGGSAR